MGRPDSPDLRDVLIFIGREIARYIDKYNIDKAQETLLMEKWLSILPFNSILKYEKLSYVGGDTIPDQLNYDDVVTFAVFVFLGGLSYFTDKIVFKGSFRVRG